MLLKHFTEIKKDFNGELSESFVLTNLRHVFLSANNQTRDVGGINAEERGIDYILDDEIARFGEGRSDFQCIYIDSKTKPLKTLVKITSEYKLSTPVFPLYKEMRKFLVENNVLSKSKESVMTYDN